MLVFSWCLNSLWHLLFQYYYYCYSYYYYCYNYYYSTVLGISMANFEPIIPPSKKNLWKCSSKENLFESYLQLSTTWFTQKYFLQTFNVLIEIQCKILSHKFLLQWYTQKGIMLASFRFVLDTVTRLSSPGLCAPPQGLKR